MYNHLCPLARTDKDGDVMCGMVPIPCLTFDCERWTYRKEKGMSKQKLTVAFEKFTEEMRKRLREKQREGFQGWDDIDFEAWDIPRRLHDKALDVLLAGEKCDKKDLVDIANFAMFLHGKAKGE